MVRDFQHGLWLRGRQASCRDADIDIDLCDTLNNDNNNPDDDIDELGQWKMRMSTS